MQIAQRIENELKVKGISARKMLAELGYSPSLVGEWKKGSEPSAVKLGRIAGYLNVSVDYLMGFTDDPTPPKKEFTEHDKINYELSRLSPSDQQHILEQVELLKIRAESLNAIRKGLEQKPRKLQLE